jgi:hypothetical protein
MPPNPYSATGLPDGHPDPLRSHPPLINAPGRPTVNKPLACDADEFITLIQKAHPRFTSTQCIYILMNEEKLGYCKKIENTYQWDKVYQLEEIMERSWQDWAS